MLLNKEEVRHLAELARLDLTDAEAAALARDFEGILAYFEELKTIDTSGVLPATGGTIKRNAHRHDDDLLDTGAVRKRLIEAFPERDGDYLKVPKVFE